MRIDREAIYIPVCSLCPSKVVWLWLCNKFNNLNYAEPFILLNILCINNSLTYILFSNTWLTLVKIPKVSKLYFRKHPNHSKSETNFIKIWSKLSIYINIFGIKISLTLKIGCHPSIMFLIDTIRSVMCFKNRSCIGHITHFLDICLRYECFFYSNKSLKALCILHSLIPNVIATYTDFYTEY